MSKYNREQYPGAVEVVPGVFIDPPCGGASIFIADEEGEIVMWNHDEITEDVSGFTAALTAVAIAAKMGPEAVRRNIIEQGQVLRHLIERTTSVG